MKLATQRTGSRDGRLLVVNRELTYAVPVPDIAPTLQAALDDWSRLEPRLREIYTALNAPHTTPRETIEFSPQAMMAPLPRAYHWVDGSAYVNHVELVRKARGAEMPQSYWSDPLVY